MQSLFSGCCLMEIFLILTVLQLICGPKSLKYRTGEPDSLRELIVSPSLTALASTVRVSERERERDRDRDRDRDRERQRKN